MPQPSSKNIAAKILLAEAANQGPEGLAFVADVLATRARRSGKSLEDIATASALNKKGVRVYQFTGAGRKDLHDFYGRQPLMLQNLAQHLIEERRNPEFLVRYPYENYVTQEAWENRYQRPKGHWLLNMEPAETVGSHVALRPRRPR